MLYSKIKVWVLLDNKIREVFSRLFFRDDVLEFLDRSSLKENSKLDKSLLDSDGNISYKANIKALIVKILAKDDIRFYYKIKGSNSISLLEDSGNNENSKDKEAVY